MKPFAEVEEINGRTLLVIGGITVPIESDNFPILRANEIELAHRASVMEELLALKEWARGKTELIANIDIDAFMDRDQTAGREG